MGMFSKRRAAFAAVALIAGAGVTGVSSASLADGHAEWGSGTAIARVSMSDLLDAHVTAFHQLFEEDWCPSNWSYDLDGPIHGIGTYAGANHLGQPFTIAIRHWVPVENATGDMLGHATGAGMGAAMGDCGFVSVVATISTELASVPFLGTIAWKQTVRDDTLWSFLPTITIDGDSALLETHIVDPHDGTVDLDDGLRGVEVDADLEPPVVIDETSTDPCITAAIVAYDQEVTNCDDARDAAFRACNRAYNAMMIACNHKFDADVDQATSDLNGCLLLASAGEVACLGACVGFTGGWGLFFCVQPCLASAAAAKIACAAAYNDAIARARAEQRRCADTALEIRAACRQGVTAHHDACVANAELVLIAALANCT